MLETEILPQEIKQQIEKIGSVEVVIGLPAHKNGDDLSWTAAFAQTGLNVLVVYPGSGETAEAEQSPGAMLLRYPVSPSERYLSAPSSIFGSFQEVFQISQKVGAKSCCVWNSHADLITANAFQQMLQPVRDQEFDLVIPKYLEMKLGALVNSGILSPMMRALYGKRIHFPMAIDLCFSSQFVSYLLQLDARTRLPRSQQWIATEAICAGLRVCEVTLPMDPPRIPESADLSSILAAALGRLFLDLERNTQFWQKSNGSQYLPAFGKEVVAEEKEEVAVDVQRMIDTFQLGYRNLAQIWGVALPPATLVELKKLTKLSPGEFRIEDDIWVRIVYDFALAHRQRAINREHLLKAMTPLYLAWAASYALEIQASPGHAFQERLERLALAYEKQKPYLLSRWRWPDRFNP